MNKFELCESVLYSISKEFENLEERRYTEEEKRIIVFLFLKNVNDNIFKVFKENKFSDK